jgi:hypothetical protein
MPLISPGWNAHCRSLSTQPTDRYWLSAVLPIFRLRTGLIWRSASIPAWLCSMSRRGPRSVMLAFRKHRRGARVEARQRDDLGLAQRRSGLQSRRRGRRAAGVFGSAQGNDLRRYMHTSGIPERPRKNHFACRVFSRGLVPRWARLPRISRRVKRPIPGRQGAWWIQSKGHRFSRHVSRYQRRRELIASSKTVSSSLLSMASRKLFQRRKPSWAPRKARAKRKGTR